MNARVALKTVRLPRLQIACASCGMQGLCIGAGLADDELERLDHMIGAPRTLRRGERLYHTGARFGSLYAVRSGSLKSLVVTEGGRQQITAFHVPGELIGVDAIGFGVHHSSTVAIEDCKICEIPYAALVRLSREMPALQRRIHRLISGEIQRDQGLMALLGGMRAGQRMGAFLLGLSQRRAARGNSPTHIALHMTREDIGSYLGMSFETVSRLLRLFREEGLIVARHRSVEITDLERMKKLFGSRTTASTPDGVAAGS
ncbi:MAG: fumarate/nitrate reduction transcriptional regulator Fnr [Betaproteobacteria bacterium]|nr:fumarate/nitrate reduction transcriptional regulator Fnr [Betaproteobacteria bacterium]